MNASEYCANCLAHGWKQLEDQTKLQRCKNCKVIQYCGKDCQREHWKKVHKKQCEYLANYKKQCEYLANSGKTKGWPHEEDKCIICHEATAAGKITLMNPYNPVYGCVWKDFTFPTISGDLHPIPIAGQSGDVVEKALIVWWHLLYKYVITHPMVGRDFAEEFEKVFAALTESRLYIWEARKVYPHPEKMIDLQENFVTPFHAIDHEVKENELLMDPLQLWGTVCQVLAILCEVCSCSNILKVLKDPLTGLPDDLKEFLSRGLANQAKYLTVADQVLDALATQVIPYQEVLKIICGGSLNQICSFCSEAVVIAGVDLNDGNPTAFFGLLSVGTYGCGRGDCFDKGMKLMHDSTRLRMAVNSLESERKVSRCDFCLQLPPITDVHRCIQCLSTMYCSETCQNRDRKIHKLYCNRDMEERKIKCGSSSRRKEARKGIEVLEESVKEAAKEMGKVDKELLNRKECSEVVGKFKLKNAKKKSGK